MQTKAKHIQTTKTHEQNIKESAHTNPGPSKEIFL
jgi:hypothetical protein